MFQNALSIDEKLLFKQLAKVTTSFLTSDWGCYSSQGKDVGALIIWKVSDALYGHPYVLNEFIQRIFTVLIKTLHC